MITSTLVWGVCALVGVVGSVVLSYLLVRAGSLAYFRSKLDYIEQLRKRGVPNGET